jgi:hypothetical protein
MVRTDQSHKSAGVAAGRGAASIAAAPDGGFTFGLLPESVTPDYYSNITNRPATFYQSTPSGAMKLAPRYAYKRVTD